MQPPISQRSGKPVREVIGVFGAPKSGKSTGWLSIAEYEKKTGSDAKFIVIDTDGDSADRLLSGRPHLDNIKVLQARNWETWKIASKIALDEAEQGDWIVIDLADRVWKYVQNYYCLAPETRVLTDDLRWVPVGELELDQGLLAFDEHGTPGHRRKWRRGKVTATGRRKMPCYLLTFDDGTEIIASSEHPWLVQKGAANTGWVTTENLWTPSGNGNRKHGSRVLQLIQPWQDDSSREAGYLAAAFDGEGHFTQHASDVGQTTRLQFAQKDNAMLAHVMDLLKMKGFPFTDFVNETTGVHNLNIGHRPDMLRFLGQFRPERLLPKLDVDRLGTLIPHDERRLVKKQFIGDYEVVTLGTDTKTFIAEGLATHNTSKVHHRDGVDDAEYLLHLRAQWEGERKGQPVRTTTTGWDWGYINGLYDTTLPPLVLNTPAHVYVTTEQADYSSDLEQDKTKRMMFGKIGVKMTGQKSLPYQVATILHIDLMAGKRVLTTVGDRDGPNGPRTYLDKTEMKDLVASYLIPVAGWALK